MDRCSCPPIASYPDTDETVTIPGPTDGTTLRVHTLGGPDGDVRLEQLAYSEHMGWYVQKSFRIPGCMLNDLVRQLRKADCLIPRPPARKSDRLPLTDATLRSPGPNWASKTA